MDDAKIISKTDNGVRVRDYEMRRRYEEMVGTLYTRDEVSQADAYVIPHFAGMEFAYTEIDAAYVWTHGGFQIARGHDDDPVFVEVHERDVARWIEFFERFGVDTTVGERPDAADVNGSVHYVLFPQAEGIDVEGSCRPIVAEKDGTVVGWGSIHLSENTLAATFVDPDHTGEGIGRTLVEQLENIAEKKM